MELSLAKPQTLRKPLMLKDYLLDDLSSCSSSGFRTYPRRQCCTSVGFLLEINLKNKPPKHIKRPPLKNPSKPLPSAFQRAIKAVKSLPFAAIKSSSSTSSNKLRLTLLPRSLSRKLLKRSFWKRNDRKEIPRLEPISQLIVQNTSPPSDFTASTATGDRYSSSSESNSWWDSDFTASDDSTASGNSSENTFRNKNYSYYLSKRLPNDKVVGSKRAAVKVGGDDSIAATSSSSDSCTSSNVIKKWPSEDEREQFSPVSVLDCPFDEDDEVSSPFQHRLARMEAGTKKRLMKKTNRFERLTQLEPVNLQKRIALSESDQESNESPQRHSSESVFILDSEEEENQASDKPFKLLQLVKATIPSISQHFKADHDNLLLDFFKEGMEEDSSSHEHAKLLKVANSWIMGQPRELFLEWDVQKNREAYIRDMERGWTWRKLNEEKQEVALELEVEVFASLMIELLNDLL
ncbi:unnamed protein product [Coffea canephora]|uniref:DUF4378 domain-containing protein n=1 Tax=Coffea canephora TaxID=49390 RepID=A0A068UNJ7_COFCA|nr:unnamed protein product [Coffea canephora]